MIQRIVVGCFPEPLQRKIVERSAAWYREYVNTQVYRDVRDLTQIDHPEQIAKLFELAAFYAGKLLNMTDLASKLGMNRNTVKKYVALLEHLFLIQRLPAWHSNEYKRLVRLPKLFPVDTGLMCAIRGLNKERLLRQPENLGLAVETFVLNELLKQAEWVREPIRFYHYRDKDQAEVDILVENAAGDCFAVEVKAAATLTARDFTGLKRVQKIAGRKFRSGVLPYDGDHTTSFGDRLFAVPLGALWAE